MKYYLLFFGLWISLCIKAQVREEPYLSWEDFVTEYGSDSHNPENPDLQTDDWERLEYLSEHPYQINRIGRDELLFLPFISEAQADSLISYRNAKHGIVSMGELQLIKDMDYYTRRYLSLFIRCDSLVLPSMENQKRLKEELRIGPKFRKGKHEIETRLDVPLYQREGYKQQEHPGNGNYYTGNALHHVLRYRYHYKREISYGLTLEKDAGEPAFKQQFYPYDYLSGYLLMRPAGKAWSFVVGDYEIRSARGLLFGKDQFSGKEEFIQTGTRKIREFKAHTSCDEQRFFRGLAAQWRIKNWQIMAFISYRKNDARFEEGTDTVRNIQYSGLHRTVSEIKNYRTLGCLTEGARIGWENKHAEMSLTGYATHFNATIAPEERTYNRYYFRGRTAGGTSLSYAFHRKRLSMQGEIALDYHFHYATEHALKIKIIDKLNMSIQYRDFSSRFISLYGYSLQQGSRVTNEQGLLVGARYLPYSKWEISGYIDCFRFPKPTFTTRQDNAKGMEASVKTKFSVNRHWTFTARYRFKTRQRNITGHQAMEYRTTNKIQMGALWYGPKIELKMQGDMTYATRQTGKKSLGWMTSFRTTWKPVRKFNLKAMAGVFFTDDYESALYVYEPQLLHAGFFSSFFYHGIRGVLVCNWNVINDLQLSARIGSTHLFNKDSFSSGPAQLDSSWKNDLSVQLRWKF